MFPLTLLLLTTGTGCETGATDGETSVLDTADSTTTGGLDTESSEPDYACGWPRNNPGTLVSTGALTGDVIDNLLGYDQCGELVELWDLFGAYNLIFIAGAW